MNDREIKNFPLQFFFEGWEKLQSAVKLIWLVGIHSWKMLSPGAVFSPIEHASGRKTSFLHELENSFKWRREKQALIHSTDSLCTCEPRLYHSLLGKSQVATTILHLSHIFTWKDMSLLSLGNETIVVIPRGTEILLGPGIKQILSTSLSMLEGQVFFFSFMRNKRTEKPKHKRMEKPQKYVEEIIFLIRSFVTLRNYYAIPAFIEIS